jgi:hypothetical protein
MSKPVSALGIANLMADAADKKQKSKAPMLSDEDGDEAPPVLGKKPISGKQKAAMRAKDKAAGK